jgi:hypothetical protein
VCVYGVAEFKPSKRNFPFFFFNSEKISLFVVVLHVKRVTHKIHNSLDP